MPHESDKEWNLRQKFLILHFDKFPIERLKCLASCFINVTMMGCSYPAPLMEQINHLSEDLRDDIKQIKEIKAQAHAVKFVKAQDDETKSQQTIHQKAGVGGLSSPPNQARIPKPMAFVKAGDDYKSTELKTKPAPQSTAQNTSQKTVDNQTMLKFKQVKRVIAESRRKNNNLNAIELIQISGDKNRMVVSHVVKNTFSGFEWEVMIDSVKVGFALGTKKKSAKLNACEDAIKKFSLPHIDIINPDTKPELVGRNVPIGSTKNTDAPSVNKAMKRSHDSSLEKFLIIESVHQPLLDDVVALKQSADFNRAVLDYQYFEGETNTRCIVYIDGDPVADCVDESKIMARNRAATEAMQELKKNCWTVKVKQLADSDESRLTKDELGMDDGNSSAASVTKAIPESNIGSKLLKMMGWSGGGVGKSGQGIAEPVSMDSVVNREGLGLQADKGIPKNFHATIKATINDYVQSDKQTDLVFSPSFSKEERAIIHQQAQKLGLKTRSYGSGEERFLIVSRKRSASQLFDHIMENGGSTSKYELVPPDSLMNRVTNFGI